MCCFICDKRQSNINKITTKNLLNYVNLLIKLNTNLKPIFEFHNLIILFELFFDILVEV